MTIEELLEKYIDTGDGDEDDGVSGLLEEYAECEKEAESDKE